LDIIRPILIACWITKATESHSEYVILAVFPWQRERASMLGFTCIPYPVLNLLNSPAWGVPGYETDNWKFTPGRNFFFTVISGASECLTLLSRVLLRLSRNKHSESPFRICTAFKFTFVSTTCTRPCCLLPYKAVLLLRGAAV